MTQMKPVYTVRVWFEDNWWLAEVIKASADADPSPLGSITQGKTPVEIDYMARDLIATWLDAPPDSFTIQRIEEPRN